MGIYYGILVYLVVALWCGRTYIKKSPILTTTQTLVLSFIWGFDAVAIVLSFILKPFGIVLHTAYMIPTDDVSDNSDASDE